jgi:hypothetical protein
MGKNIIKGIVSRDFEAICFMPLDRSQVSTPSEMCVFVFKFRVDIEFFNFRISVSFLAHILYGTGSHSTGSSGTLGNLFFFIKKLQEPRIILKISSTELQYRSSVPELVPELSE